MSMLSTIEEMHYDFRLKCDRVDSLTNQDFNPAEIDWLLNEAQEVILKTKYSINNTYRAGFESTQKRYDDLSTLVIKHPRQEDLTPIDQDGIYEIPLSNLTYPYLFLIRAQVYVDGCK